MGRHSSDSEDNSRSRRKRRTKQRSSSSSSTESRVTSRSKHSRRRTRSRDRNRVTDRRRRKRSNSSSSRGSVHRRRSRSADKGRSHRSRRSQSRSRNRRSRSRPRRSRSGSSGRSSRKRSRSRDRDHGQRRTRDKDRTRDRTKDKEADRARDKDKQRETGNIKAGLEHLTPAEQAKARLQLVLQAAAKTDEVLKAKENIKEEKTIKEEGMVEGSDRAQEVFQPFKRTKSEGSRLKVEGSTTSNQNSMSRDRDRPATGKFGALLLSVVRGGSTMRCSARTVQPNKNATTFIRAILVTDSLTRPFYAYHAFNVWQIYRSRMCDWIGTLLDGFGPYRCGVAQYRPKTDEVLKAKENIKEEKTIKEEDSSTGKLHMRGSRLQCVARSRDEQGLRTLPSGARQLHSTATIQMSSGNLQRITQHPSNRIHFIALNPVIVDKCGHRGLRKKDMDILDDMGCLIMLSVIQSGDELTDLTKGVAHILNSDAQPL
ncbi:serine/Arginine-related protein [Pimephales promelas]|nr:serine/Arginine-related protein [Pimephales promelas]